MKNLEKLNCYIEDLRKTRHYQNAKTRYERFFGYLISDDPSYPVCRLQDTWEYHSINQLLGSVNEWDEWEEKIMNLITHSTYWNPPKNLTDYSVGGYSWFIEWVQSQVIRSANNTDIDKVLQIASRFVTREDFLIYAITYKIHLIDQNNNITKWGNYILLNNQHYNKILLDTRAYPHQKYEFAKFLFASNQKVFFDANINLFLKNVKVILFAELLLHENLNKYEPFIFEKWQNLTDSVEYIKLFHLLANHLPEKYHFLELEVFKKTLSLEISFCKRNYANTFYVDAESERSTLLKHCFTYLVKQDLVETKKVYLNALKNIYSIPIDLLVAIANELKEDSLDILIEALHQDPNNLPWNEKDFFKKYFKIIESLDFRSHQQYFWDLSKNKSKELRRLGAGLLSKLGPDAIPNASELTKSKKLEARQMGFLILSLINTDESRAILIELLEQEKNDDARDIILESLRQLISKQNSLEEVNIKVVFAQKRTKLNAPLTPWLDEKVLPPLYFKDGSRLSVEAFRFLHYRMSRAKEIRIDLEAKLLIEHLDTDKNYEYASSLLDAYFVNGALANFKFCLILASILGDSTVIRQLRNKVQEFADNSRGKMAEYVVKALALNGGTLALRQVEFFSRKYKNKNKNVGAAAAESFTLVAEELGISPYDLADQIIPDFGFEGLFKTFEVEGQEYRAFVNHDFKVLFLNEDNKTLKTLPKGTPIALQEEFKEIGKEIKDIVKSQTPRLEQYLIIQRQWETEKWQSLFLNNPIMFVYATRLIWGAFNEQKQLIFTFKVQEDQTCINQDGDEVEFQEGQMIRMVHPLILETETINYWSEVLEDEGLSPAFLQLNRAVVNFDPADNGTLISAKFSGIQMSGYTFVSMLEKRGWFRGSVVDSGFISNYYKNFAEEDITAIITQEGEVCVGYLDVMGGIGNLMFVKYGSVDFGSYTYDEPEHTNDPRLIPFEQISPIIYSEVMADMQFFKENDNKQTNVNQAS
ncbi:MAG: DUF4132 domain-containing protein [Flectobacillus sp.]|uniref:DUF4132 domain-containing protein n=1 Tax=Flectobacillus sp. TaxID=50419 RepID=UPI003B9B41C9